MRWACRRQANAGEHCTGSPVCLSLLTGCVLQEFQSELLHVLHPLGSEDTAWQQRHARSAQVPAHASFADAPLKQRVEAWVRGTAADGGP